MEDEYVIGNKSNFFGVFDGHGGKKVSAYLRQHILIEYEKNLLRHLEGNKTKGNGALSRLDCIEIALVESLENVQKQVLGSREMYRQGSTVVIVVIDDGHLITANIGKVLLYLSMVLPCNYHTVHMVNHFGWSILLTLYFYDVSLHLRG